MRKLLFALICWTAMQTQAVKAQNAVQYINSEFDYFTTIEMLRQEMTVMGLTVFAEIDHFENANALGMNIRPAYVLVFGNPEVGSKLMMENPQIAFELPLKLLIYENENGVQMGYLPPSVLKNRYEIKEQDEVFDQMHKMYNRLAMKIMPTRN
jgi:uncharacterized protein (DUF302 family)